MWALALSIGVPDELFWNLTLREVEALIDRHVDESRIAARNTASIIAAIYNVHRKPGTRAFRAEDFMREPRKEAEYMTVEETRSLFNRWAKSVNAEFAATKGQEPPHDG